MYNSSHQQTTQGIYTMTNKIISYKGFDKNFKCRDFQYEVGKTYTHGGEAVACESGFHACENPLDVFRYYGPSQNKFAIVEQSGTLSWHDDDSKVASSTITIVKEIDLNGLVQAAIEHVQKNGKSCEHTTGHCSVATNTGYQSVATNTGHCSVSTNTGDYSVSTNTGDYSVATKSGDYSVATNTGCGSVATNIGNCSVSSITGNYSVATVTSEKSVAVSVGYQGKASAAEGSVIFLVYRDDEGNIIHAKCGIAGKDIKANVLYTLDADGNFVEVA
jgi:hypothetical protein